MNESKQAEPVAIVVSRQYEDGSHAGHSLEWRGSNEANDFPEGTELYTYPAVAVAHDTLMFEAGKAAGRQEVKDEQSTSDFWAWVRKAYREIESTDFTIHNMEVAYQAGRASAPAVAPADVVRELVRLTDDDLTKIYMRFVGHEGLSPRLFEDVAGCVMSAMISNNVPQCLTLNDHLLKALKDTDKVIERQLELIEQRAKGDFLNKRPVVQSLTAHRARIQKTLKSAKEHGL